MLPARQVISRKDVSECVELQDTNAVSALFSGLPLTRGSLSRDRNAGTRSFRQGGCCPDESGAAHRLAAQWVINV